MAIDDRAAQDGGVQGRREMTGVVVAGEEEIQHQQHQLS
jgi:hypothetical protein